MTVTLLEKMEYGNRRLYPDCNLSRLVTDMTGRKTLNDKDIAFLKMLRITIIIIKNT